MGILPHVIPEETEAQNQRNNKDQGQGSGQRAKPSRHEGVSHSIDAPRAAAGTDLKVFSGARAASIFSSKLTISQGAFPMSPLRKPKKFRAAKEARRRARIALGAPKTERVIEDKRRKPPKHKTKLIEEVFE
jgi:hypothetical protein